MGEFSLLWFVPLPLPGEVIYRKAGAEENSHLLGRLNAET